MTRKDNSMDYLGNGEDATGRAAEQRGTTNIAAGDDVVAVQVGQVGRVAGPDNDDTPPASPAAPAAPADTPAGPSRTVNIVSGNARVGMQTADVVGEINVWMAAPRGEDASWYGTQSPGPRREDEDTDGDGQ